MTQINTDFYLEAKTWLHAFAYLSSSYDVGMPSFVGSFRTIPSVRTSHREGEDVFPPMFRKKQKRIFK